MLESLVAWVLNNYLGKYVENLNTDQLSIALLSGEVELENLPLKKDALRYIGLPIQVRSGFIGKVKLHIPVRQIRSAPWLIVIEQLYLVIGPIKLNEWDADTEEIVAHEIKLSALDAIEARWRTETEISQQTGYYATSYSSWINYGTGLMTNIVENLQLKIKDVHIRYENDISQLEPAFACGITINSLSAQSCDSNWIPGFTQWDSSLVSFKLVELSSFAFYWDPIQIKHNYENVNLVELASLMCQYQKINKTHQYIMKPVSAKAQIKRNRSEQPLRSRLTPRIECDLSLDEVHFSLIDLQYEQMINCFRDLDDIARLCRYRLHRPNCTIKGNARCWWIYAARCVLEPYMHPSFCLPHSTWESCHKRAVENVKYVDIYMKILATPTAALGAESKLLKDAVEWNRSFDELKVLREISMRRVPCPMSAPTSSQARNMLVQWFPQWWGWYSSPAESNVPSVNSQTDSNDSGKKIELEDEILDALVDTFENNTLLKRDTVFGQFNFRLKQGTFHLCTANELFLERKPMIELQYENVKLFVETRPRTASHKFEIILGAIYLRDHLTQNSQFPVLIAPQSRDYNQGLSKTGIKIFSPRLSKLSNVNCSGALEPLFQLCYETKPINSIVDTRLHVKSQSLDIVYNPEVTQWLSNFLAGPYQQRINLPTRSSISADLMRNWEQILEGDLNERKSWDLCFDISAPQIIFVEQFTDKNAAVAVIDFGRLQLMNSDTVKTPVSSIAVNIIEHKESEDDENFMTPCSTPPGSEASDSDPNAVFTAGEATIPSASTLNEISLYEKLYDKYSVELNDLQILVGKVRDNWKFAHTKGSSTLHVLDRFNISLQIERRCINTSDPLYPSLTLNANLPKLIVHINEQKISIIRKLHGIIIKNGLPSPFKSPQVVSQTENFENKTNFDTLSHNSESNQDSNQELSRFVMLQFSVDHLALEVQSRGRSIAELQVAGVKVVFTQRIIDTSILLSVHGLLLVDALQTFGADFELLVASHKHVGMDSISGSLRDSEPCSPTSPGSPDPSLSKTKVTSPIALTQALSNLTIDVSGNRALSPIRIGVENTLGYFGLPAKGSFIGLDQLDTDALISVEVLIVGGSEPLHHANIQFNNLDIIANQETIVELIGFTRRVFPPTYSSNKWSTSESTINPEQYSSPTSPNSSNNKSESFVKDTTVTKTEIFFDFHRLNVLLLRAIVKDGNVQGRKIATATMSEARIQATIDTTVLIDGSLGGLQILNLTPEGHTHQRVISVGKDPLVDTENVQHDLLNSLNSELYTIGQDLSSDKEADKRAFSFTIKREINCNKQNDTADIKVRMASVWYTHSPLFLMELQSCATEFKQYLTNLAKSIKSAAADVAMGLVHARSEILAHSLYMNSRISSSLHGITSDVISPKKHKKSFSQLSEQSENLFTSGSLKGTAPQTPFSPEDNEKDIIDLKLNIVLDSPVVILPRTFNSPQVFVAHLGKITINNHDFDNLSKELSSWESISYYDRYNIDVRDMNLYSLDITNRRKTSQTGFSQLGRAEDLYSCSEAGQPILHDTMIRLMVNRKVYSNNSEQENFPFLLTRETNNTSIDDEKHELYDNIQVSGCVISPLKLSMTRSQYEQLLDTFQTLVAPAKFPEQHELSLNTRTFTILGEVPEEDTGVTTLNMDPQLRARMFTNVEQTKQEKKETLMILKVSFKLPVFQIELRGNVGSGEQALVDLSFQDFNVEYEKCHRFETNIQVSLRSLLMEDLLRPHDSNSRRMVSSAKYEFLNNSCYLSRSCPDLTFNPIVQSTSRGSLPDHLETQKVFGTNFNNKTQCPKTPPPSPNRKQRSQENLVLISSLIIDPSAPNYVSYYNSLERTTSIDFNSLDMVINVESWVIVLDFFDVGSNDSKKTDTSSQQVHQSDIKKEESRQGNSELSVDIKSLTLVLTRPEREVAKANISNLTFSVLTKGSNIESNLEYPVGSKSIISGRLGSMSLFDLTPHGYLYRERFISSGQQALIFNYIRLRESGTEFLDYDARLNLEMSSVLYVHTKRFVAEIQSFFARFAQLLTVMTNIRAAAKGQTIHTSNQRLSRLLLDLHAGAPVILLPVSSKSTDLLVADLGKLTVTNRFCLAGEPGTISSVKNINAATNCLLNVMHIDLINMDLYTAKRESINKICTFNSHKSTNASNLPRIGLELGDCYIIKQGPALLTKKCYLKVQVERNLDLSHCHDVPDMSIHGTLSTLDVSLDLTQYRLIRGLLAFNLGENSDDLLTSFESGNFTEVKEGDHPLSSVKEIWTLSSLRLDLLNVTLRLLVTHDKAPLALINFIKSKLTIEIFSDSTEDIDLVSQEIQLIDTRFSDEPVNKRTNVFTNILQPIHTTQVDSVQAEIHSRKRRDHSKFTVLLNNMRLMAILDWWENIKDFIFEPPESPQNNSVSTVFCDSNGIVTNQSTDQQNVEVPFELKLNITDSEIVVVEDTSQWDTNAVILKSTTVISYRPSVFEKPLSCNLNHCEMFSCVLGMEDDTALSIIDPITVNMEINKNKVLEVQLHQMNIRLSYHDVMMFLQIINSLPKQTQWAKLHAHNPPANIKGQISKLSALGFDNADCIKALEQCEGHLDDAALWLTQNATANESLIYFNESINNKQSPLSILALEVKMNCLSICIIDDCRDADVPLLELSLSQLNLSQKIRDMSEQNCSSISNNTTIIPKYSQSSISSARRGCGWLECVLGGDYYNRVLSGWEPFIEPWRCEIEWEYGLTASMQRNRLQVKIKSSDVLNLNITSTLIDLYSKVKDTWTQDYYNLPLKESVASDKTGYSPNGYRRRSPFVPFALKNETGSKMWFTTIITTSDTVFDRDKTNIPQCNESWISVEPGCTVPFTFEGRGKLRHRDTHKLRMHQLGVKIEGWRPVKPISVDKVGVYFRHATPEVQKSHIETSRARIVFSVALEGSAQKLVTVRSALLITNLLPDMTELRIENLSSAISASSNSNIKTLFLESNSTMSIPLSHVCANIFVRPINSKYNYLFCSHPLRWSHVSRPGESIQELRVCKSHDDLYRFCVSIRRENYPADRYCSPSTSYIQPAHTLTLRPPVLIVNLLPHELHYCLLKGLKGRIVPGGSISLYQVDLEAPLEIAVQLDNFPGAGSVLILPESSSFSCRVKIEDPSNRRLFLHVTIKKFRGCGVEMTVTAPYWIINKTGIPLVFRQEGVATEAAGQFEEHEIARMVAPLLFSLADPDASPTIVARVGNGVMPFGSPQWSQHFHLQPGIQTRKLRISLRDNRPDVIYVMGINVRTGRGRYRDTNIIIISPKYQLHNKSSFQLQFSQKCFATTLKDPAAQSTYLRAVPNCHMAFHWPRLDRDQLLCVRLLDISDCCWSGGLLINQNYSSHINIRDTQSHMYFLRLDVVLQGATFFIVFTDADTMPPPIRVDNYSEVLLTFAQTCCKESRCCTVRAHSSVPYALDEPTESPSVTVTVPGGISASYDMDKLGEGQQLTYENFIYIVFTGTFKRSPTSDPLDIESQQLVLDVGPGGRIILARKQPGQRSQLWRMSSSGQLQHEGSSPPRLPNYPQSDKILVLDIEGPAPQPTTHTSLMLRRSDPRRRSTQTWRFTDDGRLCCAHNNMCVQASDGFFGIHAGNTAVLGMIQPSSGYRFTENGIPVEQAVGRQKMRPGSGFLKLEITTDGPTRVLKIYDIKEKRIYAMPEERDWGNIAITQRPNLLPERGFVNKDSRELQITVNLVGGVGLSLISHRPPEELVFALFKGIILETIQTPLSKTLDVSVEDIQCDNQLLEAPSQILLHVTKPSRNDEDKHMKHLLPALQITTEVQISPNENAVIFKHLMVTLKPLAVYLEERLMLKLFEFAGYSKTEQEHLDIDENDFEMQRILTEVTGTHARRYYFGIIKLVPSQIRLSMLTASKLPKHLHAIKRKLGLTLIKFEDAAVDLEPFVRQHPFETSQVLIHSILKHFKEELKWQAAIILGSVDFLGNPLGFMNDVSEGVSGLIYEGSVGALVKNVTHGISNSAAKVTESLSDGLGKVTMDDAHQEMRLRIRQIHSGSSGDHLVAGIKGLGFGLLGGATGIFKQIYEGASNEGVQGIFSGFGKGLVGIVTKPVVGVLDLASETARAVRDSSRSRATPCRFRPPRCVVGPGNLLPLYSKAQALGQQHLYTLNRRNYSEILVAYECLRGSPEDLRIIVSSEHVRIVTSAGGTNVLAIVIEAHLSDLIYCTPATTNEGGISLYYIELAVRINGTSVAGVSHIEPVRRPRIRCDSESLARWVSQQVSYAKNMYEERLYTLFIDLSNDE